MQMDELYVKKMVTRRMKLECVSLYIFILTIFQVVVKTQMSVESVHDNNNHAFVQANSNEVRYMGIHDGLQVFMHKDVASSGMRISNLHEEQLDEDSFSTSMYLKFVPPQLDFKERHLGVPHLEKVMLINTDLNKTIHMSSISGNTLHFHSSFFQDKTIPPKGNTTFAVVYLGRAEGHVTSNLYIHTSEGTFKYQVSGASVDSPYRLRPLGGVKLPLNAAFQPLIHLHNPHHYPIQVVEVYSSGSEFHLELPGGELEGPKTLWEVPPFATKPVIRARFQANSHSNHTAYIRLKLNNSDEVLVVPLEVEVASQPGLYSPTPVIDFAIGGSLDEPTTVSLYLCNSLRKMMKVQNIYVSPATKVVSVDFQPVKIQPGTTPVHVAKITFDWKAGYQSSHDGGKIYIKTKQNQYKLVIPYTATVLEGGVQLNETSIHFLNNRLDKQHVLSITNHFKIPVAVNNVSLLDDAGKYYEITNFKPVIVGAGKSSVLFTISVRDKTAMKDLSLESKLVLTTNMSDVTVPVLTYNGRLTKVFPLGYNDVDTFDLGLIGSGLRKFVHFGLLNSNPVGVTLKSISSTLDCIKLELMGSYQGTPSEFSKTYEFQHLTNSSLIKPYEIALVKLTINAPVTEESLAGSILVKTQFETFVLLVKSTIAHGRLELIPDEVVLDNCFPGGVCSHMLRVQSTFNRPMTATGITSVPPDPRLSFNGGAGSSEIIPNSSSYIGELKWDWAKNCGAHCYLGIPFNSTSGMQWMHNQVLPSYAWDADSSLALSKYFKLSNLTTLNGGPWQSIILRLDTNEVREQIFRARIKSTWPKLSNTSKMLLPLTQVANTSYARLKLYNRASQTIVVQLVMDWAYPQAKRLLESLPVSFRDNCGIECLSSSPREFSLAQDFASTDDSQGKLTTTLAPGETYEVMLSYTPSSARASKAIIFIRNNLTAIEIVQLVGYAGIAQLKFGNRRPGSENPLTFEIADKHLKDCKEKSRKYVAPNLTVKRSFTARNIGELPIFVHGFSINGLKCEGYGFSVLNCGPFELGVNATKKIDVAFTPDFTLAKIERTLNIETSIGVDVNYTLITTLPPYFLSTCSAVLSRPSWEPLLYYSAVSFMIFLLFCVLAAAFFESDRILKCTMIMVARDKTAAPLDLKIVGSNVIKEFTSQNKKHEIIVEERNINTITQRRSQAWMSQNEEIHYDTPPAQKPRTPSPTPATVSPTTTAVTSSTINSRIDKYYSSPSTIVAKFDEPNEYSKDKDTGYSAHSKSKKKLGKRNSNENEHELNNKKKEKNGWCNVFTDNHEKLKLKLTTDHEETATNTVKQIRNDIESRKEEKRQNKRNKKNNSSHHHHLSNNISINMNKEEEETSSTTTDSSNDADKDNYEAKTKKKNTDTEEDDSGKKNNWKNVKNVTTVTQAAAAVGVVKPLADVQAPSTPPPTAVAGPAGVSNVVNDLVGSKNKANNKNNARERREKTFSKRRNDKPVFQKASIFETTTTTSTPSAAGLSTNHRVSPPINRWDQQLSFSQVVARNDSPLYSNIVSTKNQPRQPISTPSMFTDVRKPAENSTLGPIGSKKPTSTWSQLYQSNNLFDFNLGQTTSSAAVAAAAAAAAAATAPANVEDGGLTSLEDTLTLDTENMWEDQNEVMQMMHQQDSFNLSWKGNWPDQLWGNQQPATENEYQATGWGSLLHSSWSPTTWSPSSNTVVHNNNNSLAGNGDSANNMVNYGVSDGLLGHNYCNGFLNQSRFGQQQQQQQPPPPQQQRQQHHQALQQRPQHSNVCEENALTFDRFHALNSIWSPNAANNWSPPNSQ